MAKIKLFCSIVIIFTIIFFICLIYRDFYIIPNMLKRNCIIFDELRSLLPEVNEILEKYNLTYWITSGTLLGHQREYKKFIPHDDDIDLIIYEKENQNLENIFQQISVDLEKSGSDIYYEKNNFYGGKFFRKKSKVFIDIFYCYNNPENPKQIYAKYEKCRKHWPNDYFYVDELFPLQKDKFENIDVYLPKEPIKYLFRFFGNDCLTNIKFYYTHHENSFHNYIIDYTSKIFDIDITKYKRIC